MVSFELGRITIEPICNEDRDIIDPSVSRSRCKENPTVSFGNPLEGSNPSSITHESLFVENEEGIFHMLILTNVVPRVDRKYSTTGKIGSGTNSEPDSLRLPIKRVSFFCSCDDIQITRPFVLLVIT